ncbi:hypothetical protein A4U64_07615 [Rhodococcus sp. WB1]|nr:hypothetical protein AAT18_17100 [Rhodococcus aetherivorans]ANZ24589.1 hypothetical protein A4U64_07615 [Rhodococcus sp. WB1]
MQWREPSRGDMQYGIRPAQPALPAGPALPSADDGSCCHSYQPSVGTRHRRCRTGRAKAGSSAADSGRALKSVALRTISVANDGTGPQRIRRIRRHRMPAAHGFEVWQVWPSRGWAKMDG